MSVNRPGRAAEKRTLGSIPGRMPGSYGRWNWGEGLHSGGYVMEHRGVEDLVEDEDHE